MDRQSDDEFDANAQLAPFLRRLADSIESSSLTDKQLQRVGEFFMSYLFAEQVEKDNCESDNCEHNTNDPEMSDKDFKKFVVLGWWVYSEINRQGITG